MSVNETIHLTNLAEVMFAAKTFSSTAIPELFAAVIKS